MLDFYKKNKMVRIILKIFLVLLVLLLVIFLFLKLWPAFGGTASKQDQADYTQRADNYKNGKFYNEDEFKLLQNVKKGTKDNVVSTKEDVPKSEIPTITPKFLKAPSVSDFTITWFGHSSLLMQMHGMNILIDPIFSERSSPVSFAGPKRFSKIPISTDDLPQIDVVIFSHDHMDHLDYSTILNIDKKVDAYIVPLGVENDLERWGVDVKKIHNMAWWEEININGLTIACTPARHYSGRSLTDQFESLWASWVLKDEYYQVFDSGDTGFGGHFQEISDKYGEFDFALFDSGQYDLRWSDVHMNPEESYRAAQIFKTKIVMPIHWGAFKLANHPWDDPAERFIQAAEGKDIEVVTPMLGETMDIKNYLKFMNRWWKDIE